MILGIAGAFGQPPTDIVSATCAMTRQLIGPGITDADTECFSATEPMVALGVAERRIGRERQRGVLRSNGSAIVLSGMITNIDDVAREMLEETWHGEDRVERIILDAYLQHGPDFVDGLEGGFSIAIWDARQDALYLARDRIGIKSLYYTWRDDCLLFASKMSALLASGLVPATLSHPGIHSYLSYGVICEPFTAIESVYPIPPAHWALAHDGQFEFHQYWNVLEDRGWFGASLEQAAAELRPLLSDSVRRHHSPDSPGSSDDRSCVFLSGGLDSSALAALTKSQTQSVNTVSMLLDDPYRSERPYIDLVNQHLSANPVSYTLGPVQALESFDDYFTAMDQPSFDGLNTFSAARAAAAHGYQSALYGAGGDELFGAVWKLDRIRKLERVAGIPQRVVRPAAWLLRHLRWGIHGKRTQEWLRGAADPGTAYDFLGHLFLESELRALWRGDVNAADLLGRLKLDDPEQYPALFPRLAVQYFLKNQLLRISDWAGSFHGLDVRVPLLDRAIVEWSVRLPPEFKTGAYKPVLARAVDNLLPDAIMSRPKRGFGLPMHTWMQTDFRQTIEATLSHPPNAVAELIDVGEMQRIWSEFLQTGSRSGCSWTLYTLCRWTEQMMKIPQLRVEETISREFVFAHGTGSTGVSID